MKRIAALLLMGAAALSLTACGGGSSNKATSTSTASGSSEATSASSSQKTSGSSVAGETYDTGSFTVLVPDGWMVVEQLDMSQEADEDGNYPVDKESIGLIKGGESEWDAFSKPTIYIWLQDNDESMEEYADFTTEWYDERSEIDVTVGDKEVIAYETKSSYEEDEDPYIYNMVFIKLDDTHFAQVSVPIDMVDFDGVNVSDDDVMAIMESITVK